jgi:hypothetical protein
MRRAIALGLVLALATCDSITGSDDPWTVSGIGNNVLDRPSSVERIRVTGSYAGEYQNFIVECGRRGEENWDLVVNEILGTRSESTQYDGTHLLARGCNPIIVNNSNGVAWSLTEVR